MSLILAAAAVTLGLNCFFAPRGVRYLMKLRARRIRLEEQVRDLQATNKELETIVERLRSDDRYIQGLIRSELGYARPDEIVYRFASDGRHRGRQGP